ncbi:3-ketoacyl-CoA synthase [Psidium guajava]|nr:3-ketoacyl-CoA synthase [Psidium guajava]
MPSWSSLGRQHPLALTPLSTLSLKNLAGSSGSRRRRRAVLVKMTINELRKEEEEEEGTSFARCREQLEASSDCSLRRAFSLRVSLFLILAVGRVGFLTCGF